MTAPRPSCARTRQRAHDEAVVAKLTATILYLDVALTMVTDDRARTVLEAASRAAWAAAHCLDDPRPRHVGPKDG